MSKVLTPGDFSPFQCNIYNNDTIVYSQTAELTGGYCGDTIKFVVEKFFKILEQYGYVSGMIFQNVAANS